MRLRVTVLGLACLLGSVDPSPADTLYDFEVAGWTASAVAGPDGRTLGYCGGHNTPENGVSLAFVLAPDFRWSIALVNPTWSLTTGQTYDALLNLDSDQPSLAQAVAVSNGAVRIAITDNAVVRLMKARELHVKTVGRAFVFRLVGTGQLLPALRRCVETNLAQPGSTQSSNPFVAVPEPRVPPRQITPAHRTEAVALATNLLVRAGITGFRIVDAEKAPKHEAYWVAGELFGGIDIIENQTPELIASATIREDKTSCNDGFTSGPMPTFEVGWSRLFTWCTPGGVVLIAFYVIVPRSKGGYYLIGTGSQGSEDAREKDEKIRKAALAILGK